MYPYVYCTLQYNRGRAGAPCLFNSAMAWTCVAGHRVGCTRAVPCSAVMCGVQVVLTAQSHPGEHISPMALRMGGSMQPTSFVYNHS